jgi:hypothetical protein
VASSFIYEPYIETFTNENSLTISHNFGRGVNPVVEVLSDETGETYEQIEVEINIIDDNSFSFSFYEGGTLTSKTGRVIVS